MKDKQKTMISKNEKKAREFAKDRGHDVQSITEAFVACLDMAEWKDKQFAEENKWIDVNETLPLLVTMESGIRYSKPVLCKVESGGYCVAKCIRPQNGPYFWQDDNYEKQNVKYWKEIKD